MAAFNYYQWREEHREFPCSFAKLLLESLGPQAVLFRDTQATTPSAIAAAIDAITSAALRTSARVLTIHVPAWDEAKMIDTFRELASISGWSLKKLKPFSYASNTVAPIGLHRELRSASGANLAIESVPMLLAPWVSCPPSRYCPEPILELSIDCSCLSARARDGKLRADFLALPTPRMNPKQRTKQLKAVSLRSQGMNKGINPAKLANITAITSPAFAALL